MRIRNQLKTVFSLIIVLLLSYSCDTTEPLFDKYSPSGTYSISWDNLPKFSSDKNLRLGGFVGLFYKNNRTFYTVTNRGPVVQKLDENGSTVYFPVDSFVPTIVELELQDDNTFKVVEQIGIKRPGGFNTSGLLPSSSWTSNETVVNSVESQDDWGVYPGGIFLDIASNFFWVADQYNPSVMKITTDGEWVQRIRPNEGFRRVLANHTVEGGFTGVDYFNSSGILYYVTINGRSLENNYNINDKAGSVNYSIRRVTIYNTQSRNDLSMIYNVEPSGYDGIPERFVKLGDVAAINDTSFLVTEFGEYNGIERNLLYMATTNDSTTKAPVGLEGILGKTIETLTAKERSENKIKPMTKYLLYDLSSTNIKNPEGLAIINESTVAVIDNNNFGIVNHNPSSAKYELENKPIYLEIITLPRKLELSK